ncbi:MAG: GNAT family N-acetyltransferase [Candidatus Eisenbacteria bacterium]
MDERTVDTFLRCLHDERPDDPRVVTLRRRWFDAHRDKGLRAKVVVLDSGEVVALCQYMPIEHTHIRGERLLAILCMWVHGYDHHLGNRQGNGYGRLMLDAIEEDARASGADGVAAWGMDFPYWNPVSFYEHLGYERADESDMSVLVWKRFSETASAPSFRVAVKRPRTRSDRVSVAVFLNGWCTGACSQCVTGRDAVEGLDDIVDYVEYDASDPNVLSEWGISNGIYVEGEPHRPNEPPCTSAVLRDDILKLAREKGLTTE